jgi:hypothetical protein
MIKEKYSELGSFTVDALIDWASASLLLVLDEGVGVEFRIAALRDYLAVKYFLHEKLAKVDDLVEKRGELMLVERFSDAIKAEPQHLLGLYEYCVNNAFQYLRERNLEQNGRWWRLAEEISKKNGGITR